jgi:PHD/YefM family antitoxin component YafN of YafNO toxin-antitoxin module
LDCQVIKGKGDLVVMSQAHYERLQSLLELYQKLGEAEALDAAGEKGITH